MYQNDELAIEGCGNSVLPCQYNDMIRRPANPPGEHRLLWAVLEDAIRCYLANQRSASRARRLAYEEARAWLFDRRGEGLFAFEEVCDQLSIDAAALRKGLKSFERTRVLSQVAPQAGSALRHMAA
jgi:hypothetical protein